jgi:hypothetical protein
MKVPLSLALISLLLASGIAAIEAQQLDDIIGNLDDDIVWTDDFTIPPIFAPQPTVAQPSIDPGPAAQPVADLTPSIFPPSFDFPTISVDDIFDDDFTFPPSPLNDDDWAFDDDKPLPTSYPTSGGPTCAATGEKCNTDGDCCTTQTLQCREKKCTTCQKPGMKCENNNQCCSAPQGQVAVCLYGKKCEYCIAEQDKCSRDNECCSDVCDKRVCQKPTNPRVRPNRKMKPSKPRIRPNRPNRRKKKRHAPNA